MNRLLSDTGSLDATVPGTRPGVPPALLVPATRSAVGLVARDRELAELERALGQCRVGGSAVVVLRGEPGTGKTALVSAAAARARDFSLVQLRPPSTVGTPRAEWPAALAELLDACDEVTPDELVERSARALRRLAAAPGLPLLVTLDDAQAVPVAFLQAVVTAVEESLVGHPCLALVAIEELPGLPVVELEVSPVSTCRLHGLTEEQGAVLLEQVLGQVPEHGVVRALVSAVGGNPQAILGTAARLSDRALKGWEPLPDPVRLEPSQRRRFAACLEDLPVRTQLALVVAAAGRVPLVVLEAALAELELDVEAFEPAVARGVIVLQRNRLAFSDQLVRSAAYHGAVDEVRSGAHQALANAFLSAGQVEHAAEHARRGGAPTATVLGLYGQAVRVALDRADLPSAARYQEAMAGLGGMDEVVLQHLTRAAAWWISSGDLARAGECLSEAASLPLPDELRGPLVYWRARAEMADGVDGRMAAELEAAADQVAPDASGSASLMLGEAAICLLVAGDAAEAERLAARALEVAEGVGGFPNAFAEAVAAGVRVLGRLGTDGSDGLRPATSFLVSQPDALPLSPLFAEVTGIALLEQSGPAVARTWASWLERNAATTGNVALRSVAGLLEAQVSLRAGGLDEAAGRAEAAADGAVAHGQRAIAVRALALLLETQSLQGRYQPAFVTASRLFADAAEGDRRLRAVAYRSLAELELQRSRIPSAISWLKAAEFEETSHGVSGPLDGRRASWAATLAEVYVHDGRLESVGALVGLVDMAARHGVVAPAWSPAVRAVATDELRSAEELFQASLRMARDEPLLQARIEGCYAARLAAEGLAERAARRLRSAAGSARDHGANGWASLLELTLDRLETTAKAGPDLAVLAGEAVGAEDDEPSSSLEPVPAVAVASASRLDPQARWEITMLGSFSVRHEEELISMPTSLAATALKLVALRRRILVEELVEELWPESAPGVGLRRLRNVLWRVRVACGDILLRDDKLILLSPEAVTDVEVFRRIAVQALDPSTPEEKSAELARAALALYEGELLPTDRYADWAAATRESLSRLQVQLIELRVRHAVTEDRIQEALVLLDQLIESDPYEERHYLRVAELHERSGNRRRALATIGRAERSLAELGIPPSPDLHKLSQRLS